MESKNVSEQIAPHISDPTENEPSYYSPKQAAERLGVSYRTVLNNLEQLPHRRLGRNIILIPRAAIDPQGVKG